MSPISLWQEQIAAAAASGQKLQIRGGGSKAFYGQYASGDILDTRAHQGIVSYEPTELVISAKAGTPLRELEDALALQNQMLAFEPPHFGAATLGGCVAAGLSGPRRARAGAVRDFVLGAQLLDGHGKLLEFGGQVMKNVAGYDVSRFLAGSMGILGIITEVSLKVLPRPEYEQSLNLHLDQNTALQKMGDWASQPLPISATAWQHDTLTIRLSGAESAVKAATAKLGGDPLSSEQATQFWSQLREQTLDFFQDDSRPLWRLALPASCPALDIACDQTLLEWNGTQRWLKADLNPGQVRELAANNGGHATLFRGGDKSAGVFTPLTAPLMTIHQNLKHEFDPETVFNPGRLYPNL